MKIASSPPASGTLEGELLNQLAGQSRQIPFAVFAASLMIAAFAWGHVPPVAIVAWLAIVVVVVMLRRRVLERLPRLDRPDERGRLRIAVAVTLANGVAQGLSLFAFPLLPELERSLHTLVLLGLCAGSVATTAGYRPLFVAYLLPTAGALTLAWAVLPSLVGASWLEAAMSGLILMFCLVLLGLARDAWAAFSESFAIRLEQVALNRQLREALDDAEAASRAKTRFLASASHDLRQPLHTLSLFGAALEMRPLDERSHEIARSMNEALQHLSSELDALLDVSKLDAGVVRVTPANIDIGHLLERIAAPYAETIERTAGVSLSVDCQTGLVVRSDRSLLERVLRNLIDNAVKYTEKGSILVEARRRNGAIHVVIADTGVGIPDAEQARIFEEFYQIGNRERDRRKGLGLGLSIVRRLTELLDIEMSLDSAAGRGSRFTLKVAAAEPSQETPVQAVEPEARCMALDVLVIDDEPSIRLGMRTLLEGLGCRVELAASTEDALAAVAERPPDLVLADLRLQDEDDGISAIQAIRLVHPGTPAILVSGDTAPDRLREADAAGIPMLHKPVPVDQLRQAIIQTMEEGAVPGKEHAPGQWGGDVPIARGACAAGR
ncbi:MAG: response regulator [Limnobacter sp.]|nr:response regulator [Limnobacter sp.]